VPAAARLPVGTNADQPQNLAVPEGDMCEHQPRCPDATAPDHIAARVVARHPEQGWSLLCNGVISFDDLGELLPDGRAVSPGVAHLTALAA
jgi:hypothetical protein